MVAQRKYPDELRERAVRMVLEIREGARTTIRPRLRLGRSTGGGTAGRMAAGGHNVPTAAGLGYCSWWRRSGRRPDRR